MDCEAGTMPAEMTTAQRMASIESLAEILKAKRKAAIDGRRASGIENIWAEDEEHYNGIDAVNRDESGYTKPRSATAALTSAKPKQAGRSTAFLKITRPYVDAASARVADMLLPTDDRNWALRPTPQPELLQRFAVQPPQAMPSAPPNMMGRIAGAMSGLFGGGGPQTQMNPDPEAEAKRIIGRAKESAERAQTQIDDWLVECRYHAEVRKVIDSAARTGTGILKGPIPVKRTKRAAEKTPEGFRLTLKTGTIPSSVYVRNWDFYPDPNCGDNIQRGAYTWERDDITARKLRELKGTQTADGQSIYIDEMIDLCLKEGPGATVENTRQERDTQVTDDELFEIWYFHGQVSKKDMEAANCLCGERDQYPCTVTMVNDRVIKVSLSPLDCGEFPYDVMVWQAREDHWAGYGVARQMRECQKGANAAVRELMDNAGISAGPQFIIDSSKIEPGNGKWEIVPRKIWRKKAGGDTIDDVRQAFTIVTIETRQVELMNILMFWLKEAEDVTGLPMLLQGQQGKAPDTVGGMTMMSNNASGVLRRIARIFDDRVTEPHIGRYYEWLLLHGPEEAKGDFTIDARGSSALVERDMQNQAMMQMLGVSLNPAYALDPELTVREVLKGMRLDPKRFELSDEKKQALAQRQPPEDPRITAAKIAASVRGQEMQAEAAKFGAKLQAEQRENAADRMLEKLRIEVDAQLGAANLTSEERMALNDAKVTLSGLAMKLNVQQRLSAENVAHQKDLAIGSHMVNLHKNQVTTPPTEPAGRAQAGQAFEQ